MTGRTELTAALTALINAVFGMLAATGIWNPGVELIASINGVMVPLITIFLAARVTKVESSATSAAISSQAAEIHASEAASTSARVEAAQKVGG